MFTEMIDNLCFGDTKKIEKLDFIFQQVCFKGKFTEQEMKEIMYLGIMHGNELKAICGCDFNTFVMVMYDKSIQNKEIMENVKTNPFELLMLLIFLPLFFTCVTLCFFFKFITSSFVFIYKKIKELRK